MKNEKRCYSSLDHNYILNEQDMNLMLDLRGRVYSKHNIVLDIFGSIIYIEAKHTKFIDDLRDFIGLRETSLWRPYDFKIYAEWESLDPYFYRARPLSSNNELKGIYFEHNNELKIWNSHRPPFPPTDIGGFNNNIAAFHSAALEYCSGKAMLILGNQRTGKTTLSINLVNSYNYSLLTDEVSYFLNGKNLVEPFPRWFNLVNANNIFEKNTVSANQIVNKISSDPVKVDKLVFLEQSKILKIETLNSHEAIKFLLLQTFNVSKVPTVTIDTIFRLIRESTYIKVDVVDYLSLNEVARLIDKWVKNDKQQNLL